MKKLAASLLFVAGIAGVGCGGGGGGHPGPVVVTYTLVSNVTDSVAAGNCVATEGPYSVGNGSMAFTLVDTPTGVGNDSMDIAFVSDSIYSAAGCNFSASAPVYANTNISSDSRSFGGVPADNYVFVVGCNNIVDPCIFNITWTATY
jgi:hypothetical protein